MNKQNSYTEINWGTLNHACISCTLINPRCTCAKIMIVFLCVCLCVHYHTSCYIPHLYVEIKVVGVKLSVSFSTHALSEFR